MSRCDKYIGQAEPSPCEQWARQGTRMNPDSSIGTFGRCESGSTVSRPVKLTRARRRILTSPQVQPKRRLSVDRSDQANVWGGPSMRD